MNLDNGIIAIMIIRDVKLRIKMLGAGGCRVLLQLCMPPKLISVAEHGHPQYVCT